MLVAREQALVWRARAHGGGEQKAGLAGVFRGDDGGSVQDGGGAEC